MAYRIVKYIICGEFWGTNVIAVPFSTNSGGTCPPSLPRDLRPWFFGLVTKHACDRRTDGQNYEDRASIAASRGKNHFFYSRHGLAAGYRSRRWM